jgi:diguanylate cyclase (GGDEF)-like protein/PAS domain S-box-containing protein
MRCRAKSGILHGDSIRLTGWERVGAHKESMLPRQKLPIAKIATLLEAGIGYFVLAAVTIYLTNSSEGCAPVWPANALLVAIMLQRPRGQWPAILVAGFIGNALANLVTREALAAPLLFSLSNVVEVLIAAIALDRVARQRQLLADTSSVFHFLLWGGLIAPLVSACLGALTTFLLFRHPTLISFGRWFAADSLGLLIFLPFFSTLVRGEYTRFVIETNARQRSEFVALMALTAFVAFLVFAVAKNPLLFLCFIPLLLVTFRIGWLGTNMALTIIALIGGISTMSGLGPIVRATPHLDVQIYFFQVYIAAMLLTQMPIAAALATRQDFINKLRESEQSLRLLAAQSPILLLSFDLEGACQRLIGTTEILLGRDPIRLVGRTFSDISEEGQYELRRAHNAALEDLSCSHSAEFRTFKHNDLWLEAVFRANFDHNGLCAGTIASIHDVTQRKNQELSLSRRAMTDSLTGLLNRAGFRTRLEHALLGALPGAVSIAVIDVDRFKLINDNSGHQIGDFVLREIAQRITSEVRSSDAVGRLGGDEFIILLNTTNWEMIQDICHRIVSAVSADPITLPSGSKLKTAISCGVARLREGLTADELINEADLALYEAKRGGRNRVVAA